MKILVIGGGPAGLRAAEVAAGGGAVTVFDAQPSAGRKFLVAGRGGLNLTKEEPIEHFTSRYEGGGRERWAGLLAEFGPAALRAWAAGLGIETFAASTGRVYPRELKAAPLLRRWVRRLREAGVEFAVGHRWKGLRMGAGSSGCVAEFCAGGGVREVRADAVVLALGGASWPRTGSDGGWVGILERLGVAVAPLEPANCGWECAWPPEVPALAEGMPLKNVAVSAGGRICQGELLVTKYGLEGGALYALAPVLRAMRPPAISIDFKPSQTCDQLVAKMGSAQRNLLEQAVVRWRLPEAAQAIITHYGRGVFATPAELAAEVKNFALALIGPRPLAEAISSAGGVRWSELDGGLMIRKLPGVFVAGEMIDWEAPTGGYLLQGCFATGTRAGKGALAWAKTGAERCTLPISETG